jgi:hypothetical protein
MCPNETIVLVSDVPMLAPITIGIAPSKLIVPAETRATTIVVVVELDCITAVAKRPINKLTNGFDVADKI